MGVPMLRPTPVSPMNVNSMVPIPAWFDIFRFCSISDLGASLAVDKHWKAVADSNHVWADAYDRTQTVDDSSSPSKGPLRSLIQRPFGEDAVGWHVAVLAEDGQADRADSYFMGHIVAYSSETDTYLVAHDGSPAERQVMSWEQERRKRTAAMRHNPSLAGKSRFSFLSPPSHKAQGSSLASSSSQVTQRIRDVSCWKCELKHNVLHAPSRGLTQLQDHSDEVLFVVFSPCGTRLASCSRDLQTIIFKVSYHDDEMDSESKDSNQSSRRSDPHFEREAIFAHQTAPCRAIWWPIPPYDMVAVSTEDAGGGWQASKVEIWQIGPNPESDDREEGEEAEQYPAGVNAHCMFQCHNRPFDIYAAIFPWPPSTPATVDDPEDLYKNLCFLAGWAVLRENEHYVQWLNVWPGPRHPLFDAKAPLSANPRPLARLRLEGEMNYLHCLEVGPAGSRSAQQILAMTGSTPHLCNEIGLMDLEGLQRRGEGEGLPHGEVPSPVPQVYDVGVKVHSMGERVVLSAKWNSAGDFILLNTRPYAHGRGALTVSREDTFEDLLVRPAPDLSTRMELLLLDATSLDVVSVFDGHFAFTTKESPFLIFTEEWANSDFLASGGEDHRVYVWHRRHGRLVRRLCGHTEPVNAVSWNGKGLLASASDDHSVIIWASAGPFCSGL